MPDAVIFDLDGVLIDSEALWNQAKVALVREAGGRWIEDAQTAMLGMSAPEWSAYMHEVLAVPLTPEEINRQVVARMTELYRARLPLLPGAVRVVRELGELWPLGLASSSNRELIDLVLDLAGIQSAFSVTVSSEEVGRGKPAPDVYLEAARRLRVEPSACVAIEDSSNGLRAGAAAGMALIAIPNPDYPPSEDALALAGARVDVVGEVTADLVRRVSSRGGDEVPGGLPA